MTRLESPPRLFRLRERGSATLWVLALASVVWFSALAVVLVAGARAGRHRAGAAADLAALAAADRAIEGKGVACRAAAQVARASGARVVACAVHGGIADVTAETRLSPTLEALTGEVGVRMRARAGPSRGPAHSGESRRTTETR